MSERPKILTAVTVPSGGWDLNFKLSDASSLDTSLTATVSAGTYYVAWDWQTDDLLYELALQMRTAINAVGGGFGTQRGVTLWIDSNRRVNIRFVGADFDEDAGAWGNDVELTWSTSNADLIKALGVDSSSDWVSTGTDQPTFTAERQHGYGWYAVEDGQLADLGKPRADFREATTTQSRALDGSVKTVQWATRYTARVSLGWLTAAQTWSDGQGYGDTPTATEYPYNQGLECWFAEAAKGTQFRVYENDPVTTGNDLGATEIGVNDVSSGSYLQDSGKSWATDPQAWKGYLVQFTSSSFASTSDTPQRFYVSTNTDVRLTSPAGRGGGFNFDSAANATFYVHDARYRTYVLDTSRMRRFEPDEIPNLDRYNIEIPLLRYVA